MGKPETAKVKHRAFVSSVIEGFKDMREAARRGVIAGGLEPVLVEDFPSLDASPRNACLDGVDSSDVFIAIVGERAGSRTPSGKLVVEEELERARTKALPILAFLQDTSREPDAKQFADRLSDYVDGYLRSTFRTAADLEIGVRTAIVRYGAGMESESISGDAIIDDLRESRIHGQDPSVRFVLTPERGGEVIELVRLEAPGFHDDVYRLAHDRGVSLFSYEAPKEKKRTGQGILFSQSHGVGAAKRAPDIGLEIRPDGRVLIDHELYIPSDLGFGAGMVIHETDIVRCLRSCFAFVDRFYRMEDAYIRHTSFWFGTSLANAGFRAMVKDPPPGGAPIHMRAHEQHPILAEDPRRISRDVLGSPDAAIERVLAYLRRRLEQ